jgi:hypothetical protein
MSVRPSVLIEQLGYHSYHWMDFLEVCCLGIFLKSVEEIKVPLKFGNNDRYVK